MKGIEKRTFVLGASVLTLVLLGAAGLSASCGSSAKGDGRAANGSGGINGGVSTPSSA
jgi:hypothetical protein